MSNFDDHYKDEDYFDKYWWARFEKFRNKDWERKHSSLYKKNTKAKYEDCVEYSKKSIAKATNIKVDPSKSVIEITKPYFSLIGRVNTSQWGDDPKNYYDSFLHREYISFSTVFPKNISRFKARQFFLYNLEPQDIVHVFPMDSDTDTLATNLKYLCGVPSIWLDINDLEVVKNDLRVYDQITCKTKRDGEIIKPVAVLALNTITDETKKYSYNYELPIVLAHPDSCAHDYQGDVLRNRGLLEFVSEKMQKHFGIDTNCMYYE